MGFCVDALGKVVGDGGGGLSKGSPGLQTGWGHG